MPELPEVQTVVSTLRPAVVGAAIKQAILYRPEVVHFPAGDSPKDFNFPRQVKRRTITDLFRRGKRIVFVLDSGDLFYIHLGMSGRLTLQTPDAPLEPHTHLQLLLNNGQTVRFVDPRRFGGIWWLGHDHAADAGLGPEPLTMTPNVLTKRLSTTHRGIKNALLDQHVIAGLGNIYVDESLFLARLHPLTPANQLKTAQIAALCSAIKKTLRQAIRHRGSTLRDYRDANNQTGHFQTLHQVYGRAGERCARCGTALQRILVGGRGTCFCPNCQKLPSQVT